MKMSKHIFMYIYKKDPGVLSPGQSFITYKFTIRPRQTCQYLRGQGR